MSRKLLWCLLAIAGLMTLTNTGCFWITTQGPNLGFLSIPIPVSPYCPEGTGRSASGCN